MSFLSGCQAVALKVGRGLKAAARFAYDGVVHHLGPAVGTEFGQLHLGDLLRSLGTAGGFTSVAGFLVYLLQTFNPFVLAATKGLSPLAGMFASLFFSFVLDLLRRIGQQSVVPAPATTAAIEAAADAAATRVLTAPISGISGSFLVPDGPFT